MRGVAVLAALGLLLLGVYAETENDNVLEEMLGDDSPDVSPFEAPSDDVKQSPVRGRTFKEWGKKLWKWMGWDDDYYEYEEVYYYPSSHPHSSSYSSYGAPDAYGSSGSASGSSYVSYHPAPHHGGFHSPARGDHDVEDDWSFTDLLYDVAVAVVPMGLILSALPTGFFTLAVRRRNFEDNSILDSEFDPTQLPLLNTLMESDLLALTDWECQMKLFCEVSRVGQHENATLAQRAIYYLASLTPDYIAERFGLDELFRASRDGTCSDFHCLAASQPPKVTSFDPLDTNKLEPDDKKADSVKDMAGDSKI